MQQSVNNFSMLALIFRESIHMYWCFFTNPTNLSEGLQHGEVTGAMGKAPPHLRALGRLHRW